jgi:hypothetical protein
MATFGPNSHTTGLQNKRNRLQVRPNKVLFYREQQPAGGSGFRVLLFLRTFAPK